MIGIALCALIWMLPAIALWTLQSASLPQHCVDWRDRVIAIFWPVILLPYLAWAFLLLAWKKGRCE